MIVALATLPAIAGCEKVDRFFDCYNSGSMVAADHGILFHGDDMLAYPGQTVELVTRVQSPRSFEGVGGVTIDYYQGETRIGSAMTMPDGFARIRWQAPAEGTYLISARPTNLLKAVDSGYRQAPQAACWMVVSVRPRDAAFIVVDLDHTVVDDGMFKVLTSDQPKAMPKSADVLNRLSRQFSIIYLTQRPDELARKSKVWLQANRFPLAPLLTAGVGNSLKDAAKVKGARLALLRERFPNVVVGVGDQMTDVQAYMANKMSAYLLPEIKGGRGELQRKAADIRGLSSSPRVQVVENWEQIELSILEGKRFTPEAFARLLEAKAEE